VEYVPEGRVHSGSRGRKKKEMSFLHQRIRKVIVSEEDLVLQMKSV
jgi:hypothetical protein